MATWKEKYNKKYNYPKSESHSLSDISKDTGVSKKGLQQIYNKGIGAYKTNPQSVRPSVTSKEQWAMARVYSSVMGGKASKVDAKELKMQMGGSTNDFDRTDYYKGYYERLSPSNFNVMQKGGKIQIDLPMATSHDGIDEVDAIANGMFAKGGDIGDKIRLLKSEGYPQKQAVAIALDMKDRGKFEKGGETDFNPDGKIKDKIVHASGDAGGMLVGKRHSNGGIKAINKSTGQPLEMEGGEVVITRDAVSDNKKRSFNGKMMTNRQILSEINESGGGVSFADGGQVPNDVQFDCNAEYEYGGKTMCGKDLAYALGGVTTAIVTDPNEAMADLKSTYGFGDVYAKGGEVNEAYVDFMNKDKGFKVERKYFKTYEDAEKWARNEFEKFSPDMIGYTEYERPLTNYAKGGTIECGSCDWSWERKDGGDDMYVCHKCGTDNTEKYNDAELFDDAREQLGKEYLENLDKFAQGGQLSRDEFPDNLDEATFVKDLGGSTGAKLYEYKGKRFVVKAGIGLNQSFDENKANQVYHILDVPVPRSTYLDSGEVVKEFIGKEADVDYDNPNDVKLIARGYVADALLGNWDIYKNDNIILKEGTRTPFRIDSGGSLRYRARGEEKDNFGREVIELETLKENNPKLKPYITDTVIKKGIEKVLEKKLDILSLFASGDLKDTIGDRISYLEGVLNEINDRKGVVVITKLSKLKKGDKFYFPLDEDDEEIGRTNPLDTIYVFDGKIKSTYNYSSKGSNFSTSTNRDVVIATEQDLSDSLELDALSDSEIKKEKVEETKEPSFEEKFLENKISELRKRYEIKKRYLSEIQKGIALRDIRKYEIALDEIRLNNTSFETLLENFINSTTVEFGDINEKRTPRKGKSISGEKSELTKKEYDAVRSESFINWFGDWELANETGNYEGVSKIINSETKEPLVVYHGTDTKFISWETYITNNLHYFAKKKRFADFFATSWQQRTDSAGVDSASIKADNPIKGTFVYSCFLDIKNPIDFTPFGIDKVPFNDYLKYLEVKYDLDLYKIEGYNDLKDRTEKVYSWVVIRKWQQFNLFIKNNTPYDGFSFYEFIPDSQRRGFEDASLSFTAFNSNQIKFTNNTSFSKFTDDSRLEIGGIIF